MTNILETKLLSKRYKKSLALNKVSLAVKRGDIYGLLGSNGAGKTTIIRLIAGLINPNGGEISLFGNTNFTQEMHRVGFIIERPFIYPHHSAEENLRIYAKLSGKSEQRITDVLELIGLENAKYKKVEEFSFGMKQRLSIGIAIISDPELLVLDEPLNGLDPIGIHDLRNLILKLNKEYNVTVVLSSHILEELSKVATRCAIIEDGNLLVELTLNDLPNNINGLSLEDIYLKVVRDYQQSQLIGGAK